MPDFKTVAKVGDIPPGEGRAYEYDDRLVAVFNDHGTYRAIDDMCPHMGASLATGHLQDGVVACPWHGWSFDTRDGTWCDNRRLKIDTFLVRVVDAEIQIAAVEQDPPADSGSTLGSLPPEQLDSKSEPQQDSES